MPKTSQLRPEIYKFLLDYFKNRHNSQALQIRKSNEYDIKFPTIKSIIDLVAKSERYVVIRKGEKLNTIPTIEQIVVSEHTVRKAIEEMISDGKLRKINGSFEYVPHMDRSLEYHPILEISNKIDISIGLPEDLLILTVDPAHILGVTNYLKAIFYRGDIIFIPIADKIICASILPHNVLKELSEEKRIELSQYDFDLHRRISAALHGFHIDRPDFTYGYKYEEEYFLRHNPKLLKEFKKRWESKMKEQKKNNKNADNEPKDNQENTENEQKIRDEIINKMKVAQQELVKESHAKRNINTYHFLDDALDIFHECMREEAEMRLVEERSHTSNNTNTEE